MHVGAIAIHYGSLGYVFCSGVELASLRNQSSYYSFPTYALSHTNTHHPSFCSLQNRRLISHKLFPNSSSRSLKH
ncbi:hypothetical protein L1887_01036 [Cichorium endivia]|nr:hypothetical protein L1887_01036 [Cichorium endivia]